MIIHFVTESITVYFAKIFQSLTLFHKFSYLP